MYPTIALFTPQAPDENLIAFGQRALAYVLEYDNPYLLDLNTLETAHYVATIAVRAHDMEPCARESLQRMRCDMATVILHRKIEAADRETMRAFTASVAGKGGQPSPSAPIVPRKPSPVSAMPIARADVADPF